MEQTPKLVKLQVQDIDNDKYVLVDDNSNQYIFNLYFYETDKNDIKNIYMSKELLNPNYYEYSDIYNFGPLGRVYGRKLSKKTIQDVIILEKDKDKIILQRYYG